MFLIFLCFQWVYFWVVIHYNHFRGFIDGKKGLKQQCVINWSLHMQYHWKLWVRTCIYLMRLADVFWLQGNNNGRRSCWFAKSDETLTETKKKKLHGKNSELCHGPHLWWCNAWSRWKCDHIWILPNMIMLYIILRQALFIFRITEELLLENDILECNQSITIAEGNMIIGVWILLANGSLFP